MNVAPKHAAEGSIASTSMVAMAASGLELSHLPADAVTMARHCLLDWLGITICAANEPLVCILADNALEEGGRPVASLVGRAQKVSARQAALVNGSASHALDYDDVNVRMLGHPTVAVLSSVLALAEAGRASGGAFLTAFAAGYEAAARVGDLVRPGHYASGFHVTATVGAIAAAAGSARLLGLDADRTAAAMGIAATQAAGLKSMFGTMCKPLHAGKANENGVLAAQLAARGFESRGNVIECTDGFAATQSKNFEPERPVPEGGFYLLDNLFKYHACCYQTHAAIEAVRTLRETRAFDAGAIDSIDLLQDSGADSVCNIAVPRSGLEAKFSLRMTAAMAAAGVDTGDPASFSDEMVGRGDLGELRDRVTVRFADDWPVTRSVVSITLKDGSLHRLERDSGVPEPDLDLQQRRLVHKFMTLAAPALGRESAERLADLALNVDRADSVGEIAALMTKH